MTKTIKRSLLCVRFDDGSEEVLNLRVNLTKHQVAEMLRHLAFKIDDGGRDEL